MYNIKIDSRDIKPCDIQIIQKLIENGTSLVVVKKVGDSLLFGIAKQNIDIPKGKTIKIKGDKIK